MSGTHVYHQLPIPPEHPGISLSGGSLRRADQRRGGAADGSDSRLAGDRTAAFSLHLLGFCPRRVSAFRFAGARAERGFGRSFPVRGVEGQSNCERGRDQTIVPYFGQKISPRPSGEIPARGAADRQGEVHRDPGCLRADKERAGLLVFEKKKRGRIFLRAREIIFTFAPRVGEMAEWSIVAVSKTVEPQGSGGSNPSLSAINAEYQQIANFTPKFTPKM